MLSDLYGCPVNTIASSGESPALGAAILAGVGAGVYTSVQQGCDAVIRMNTPELPDMTRSSQYEPYYRVFCGLYPALKDSYQALSVL
jgi:xylulokinase